MVRRCYICHVKDISGNPSDWVNPCQCSGPSQWAHQACLLSKMREQEQRYSYNTAQCGQCQTKLRLWPHVNVLVEALGLLYDFFTIVTVKTFNLIMVALQISINIVFNSTSLLGFIHTQFWQDLTWELIGVSVLVIVINNAPWEMLVLRCLRKGSKLPHIGFMFPVKPPPAYRTFQPEDDEWDMSLLGSLLLAPISCYVGDMFFPTDTPLVRFLKGAILYIAVRGVLWMYYMQQIAIYKAERRVMPLEPTS